jgi:hypothetical protein
LYQNVYGWAFAGFKAGLTIPGFGICDFLLTRWRCCAAISPQLIARNSPARSMARVKIDVDEDRREKDRKGKAKMGKENQGTNVETSTVQTSTVETGLPRVAVLGTDWKMGPLKTAHISNSNGWWCLKKTDKGCNIFTRKQPFVIHMKDYHNLVPDFSEVRGRPKVGTRKRPRLSDDAKLRQDDAQSGVFPRRFYNAKRKYLIGLMNSNLRMFELEDPVPPEGCVVWCKNRSEEQYRNWRQSAKATRTLNSTLESTRNYWAHQKPQLDSETVTLKVCLHHMNISV